MSNFVTHGESAMDGTRLRAKRLHGTHADRPIRVRYDLMAVAAEGTAICPESAACVGAVESLLARGWIGRDGRVVLYTCGAAQKYPNVVPAELPLVRKDEAIDWAAIAATPRD